jgi:hypothetical protein
MFAAPDFQGVGPDAEICGGFMGVELGFTGHAVSPFSVFACAGCGQAGFEEKIRGGKNIKIPGSVAGKRKNPRGQRSLEGFCQMAWKITLLSKRQCAFYPKK